MSTSRNPATEAFLTAAAGQLDAGVAKINHCVTQLTDEQLWWRPASELNSIANLLLHLTGNVRQWLICGLSPLPDGRDRQAEFDDRSGRSCEQLMAILVETVEQAKSVLGELTDQQIIQKRPVQEFQVSGAEAIWDSVAHFKGHVQEIVLLSRMQLGQRYRFDFVPKDENA